MTDIVVGVAERRCAFYGRRGEIRTVLPAPGGSAEAGTADRSSSGLYGDELRARAWLWRHFGVGTYASGGAA